MKFWGKMKFFTTQDLMCASRTYLFALLARIEIKTHKQIIKKYVYRKFGVVQSATVSEVCKLLAESASCKRNPQNVSGFRINSRNPITFAESTCICGIGNN